MKQGAQIAVSLVIGALVAGTGGYWLGSRGSASHSSSLTAGEGAVAQGQSKERKLLYYRNPMGLPDTSPTPKKDPMGMDYLPVYEGEDVSEQALANQVKISTEKVQKLGVKTQLASLRVLDKVVRVAGRVEPDESRIYAISPKFEGYVERLHVSVTGQPVGKGQPLFEVYSPELVSAQREYAIAAQGVESLKGAGSEAQTGMKQLAESSLLRLKNWDISEEQVKSLAQSGNTKRTLTYRSPVSGVVTEKKALQGMRFMPGEVLYQVADLSSVWVVADVFEQDIGLVKAGAKARVKIDAYPEKQFEGKITYVYPTLNGSTRTVPVRVELPNPGLLLKPAMFAQVELSAFQKSSVVTVPTSSVIDSGLRQVVLVQKGEGRFEPRDVKLGARSDHYVEIREGVKEGEPVVVSANFLIDAESNLKAALAGMNQAASRSDKASFDSAASQKTVANAGHQAAGTIDEMDANAGTVSISHGPVASLKWPAMTMEFKVANTSLLKGLKSGAVIEFEFVERAQGEWVITQLKRASSVNPAAGSAHSGH